MENVNMPSSQIDKYLMSEDNNWSEINQSNCAIHGRKLVSFLHTVINMGKHSEGLRVIFAEFSDIVENDILTMERFLDISKFLYSGGWQVCGW